REAALASRPVQELRGPGVARGRKSGRALPGRRETGEPSHAPIPLGRAAGDASRDRLIRRRAGEGDLSVQSRIRLPGGPASLTRRRPQWTALKKRKRSKG